jgi:hypothetical protein
MIRLGIPGLVIALVGCRVPGRLGGGVLRAGVAGMRIGEGC